MKMLIPMSSTWSSKNPFRIFDDFDRLVDGILQPNLTGFMSSQLTCDLDETKAHYLMSLDMPGVNRDTIQVEVKDHQLFISGEKTRSVNHEKIDSCVYNERSYGKFQRTLRLPETINVDKIEAHYEDGVLEVILPKLEAPQGKRIEIQSGKSGFFSQ